MRTDKELLQIMLDSVEAVKYRHTDGLCHLSSYLRLCGIINSYESCRIKDIIHANRPNKYSSIAAFISRKTGYYWPKGWIKPRRKWLNQQLAKL